MPELDRRDFLKLVGVGAGGAAASGCADHVEQLIPYVVQPEEITPGIALFYASTCQECPAGCGVHVRTREGRPVKLEGNPEHPVNRGALCARGQAAIGRAYHPDRYAGPMRRGENGVLEPIDWGQATALLAEKLRAANGRTQVLGGRVGPTLDGLIERWLAAVGGGRTVYEPFAFESLREASKAVFGVDAQPRFDLTDADYVIDFGADCLDAWLSTPEHQRQLHEARDVSNPEGRAARFVYVGPRLSVTAGSADEWLPAKPGTEGILALGIARVAFDERRRQGKPMAGPPELLERVLAEFDAASVAKRTGVAARDVRRVGLEIANARRGVALPPGVALTSRRATAAVGAVLVLDAVVGAVGRSVWLAPSPSGRAPAGLKQLQATVDAMKAGRVSVLLVHDSNPVYSLPPALGFAEALESVDFVVSTASIPDETSARADLVLPDHTSLEAWGDAAPRPGVRSLVQPTLRPLVDTRALGDTLLETGRALGETVAAQLPGGSFRDVLQAGWADTDWRAALQRGGVWSDAAVGGAEVGAGAARLRFEEPEFDGDGEHVLLATPSPLLYDGRGANLPWLQETPDPVTKIAWQSWLEVSRATADGLGISEGDVVKVTSGAGSVEVPIFPRGGLRDDVVALAIGQGHSVGRYASRENDGRPGEARGVNVLDLLPAAADENGGRAWLTARVTLEPTGAHRRLPNTQRSDNKRGRQLGEMVPLAVIDANGDGHDHAAHGHEAGHGEPAAHGEAEGHGEAHGGGFHELRRPFDPAADAVEASPYRWGMTIDLDRCTGCSACVVACSVENNVPTVGEEGVLRNRQMQWLRIERYLGDGEQELLTGRQRPRDREELGDVDVRNSPMMCQQCGAAPCEPVCPVLATYHNHEGLNGMIYNRCIGTRYCSNNCPYKVRRYNWFDYGIHNWPDPMQYMLNPDVTVRGQGVMEKCTFCIQRIEDARQQAKDEGRPIADGEVTPACAQTCPSQAITFGNLRDENSRASKQAAEGEKRSYHALHVLNTRPSITYLARVGREGESEA